MTDLDAVEDYAARLQTGSPRAGDLVNVPTALLDASWRLVRSRHVWGPFWAGAPPAASPLLGLYSGYSSSSRREPEFSGIP